MRRAMTTLLATAFLAVTMAGCYVYSRDRDRHHWQGRRHDRYDHRDDWRDRDRRWRDRDGRWHDRRLSEDDWRRDKRRRRDDDSWRRWR